MRRSLYLAFSASLLLLLLLSSCFRSGKGAGNALANRDSVITVAKLLSMHRTAHYTTVTVGDPWRGGVLHRYVLVPRDQDLPADLPEGTVVRTPISNALVYSSVHTSLFNELGSLDAVKGVVDKQYFNDSTLVAGINDGTITDCGNSMNPTVERVINMQPDAILLSPYQDASYGQIAKMDIPIIECADYLEYDPLGRAEWVKFYGELLGKRDRADSLYQAVVDAYNEDWLLNLYQKCGMKTIFSSEKQEREYRQLVQYHHLKQWNFLPAQDQRNLNSLRRYPKECGRLYQCVPSGCQGTGSRS